MKKQIFLSLLLAAFVQPLLAEEQCDPSPIETPKAQFVVPGEVNCIGQICYYIPQKSSVGTLIRELKKSVTGSISNSFNNRGFIETGRDRGEMSFWHRCKETLEEMKKRVVELDTAIVSTGRERVFINVEIYQITNSALRNFSFGITGLYDGVIDTKPAVGTVNQNDNGGFDMNVSFGNLTNHLLSLKLSKAKGMNQAYSAKSIPFDVLEGEDLRQSRTQEQYRDSTTGFSEATVKETGYRLSGRAYIDESTQQIVIKDFGVFYATPSEDIQNFGPDTLETHRMEITVPRNSPYVIVGDQFDFSSSSKDRGLPFYLKNSTIKTNSKTLIFVTAWPAENPPPKKELDLKGLTEEEIASLPKSLKEDVLKSARFTVLETEEDNKDFGLIGFQLDQNLLTKENYNKLVQVSLVGADEIVTSMYVRAQYLTKGVFQVPSAYSRSTSPEVKINLQLKWRDKKKPVKYKLLHIQDVVGDQAVEVL